MDFRSIPLPQIFSFLNEQIQWDLIFKQFFSESISILLHAHKPGKKTCNPWELAPLILKSVELLRLHSIYWTPANFVSTYSKSLICDRQLLIHQKCFIVNESQLLLNFSLLNQLNQFVGFLLLFLQQEECLFVSGEGRDGNGAGIGGGGRGETGRSRSRGTQHEPQTGSTKVGLGESFKSCFYFYFGGII